MPCSTDVFLLLLSVALTEWETIPPYGTDVVRNSYGLPTPFSGSYGHTALHEQTVHHLLCARIYWDAFGHGALSCFLKEEYEVLEKMVRLERGVEADGNLREHESARRELRSCGLERGDQLFQDRRKKRRKIEKSEDSQT